MRDGVSALEILDYPSSPAEFKELYESIYQKAYPDEANGPCDPVIGAAAFAWALFCFFFDEIDADRFRHPEEFVRLSG